MRKYLMLLAFPLAFVACDDDDENSTDQDVSAPEIEELKVNGHDHDVRVNGGDKMTLEAHIHDDQGLKEAKVDIHDVFDGHTHGKNAGATWEAAETYPLSGKEAEMKEDFQVPGQATAGRYHAVVRALDEAGNEAEFREINFVLENGQQPTFNITDPDFSKEVHAPKGSNFSLKGSVDDDKDLAEVVIVIEHHEEHGHDDDGHDHGKKEGPIVEEDWDLNGSNDTTFDLSQFSVTIPSDAEEGDYKLEIVALDSDGNYGLFEGKLHIM